MTRAALEIRIDRTACQGAQACARHAPGTFSLGSDGKSRAADAPLAGRIVGTLTGHGLKDPDRAGASAGSPIRVEDGLAGLSRLIEQAHVR